MAVVFYSRTDALDLDAFRRTWQGRLTADEAARTMEPGPLNAITDVAGVGVGHSTIISGDSVRTGVTVVIDDAAPIETDAAMRVALSVAIALRTHRPKPYDGPIQIIASEVRMSRGISDAWRRELTGTMDVIDAGQGHTAALNPQNPRFVAAMATVIDAGAEVPAQAAATARPEDVDLVVLREGSAG